MEKSRGNVIDPLDVIEGISLDDLVHKTRKYPLPEEDRRRAEEYQREHYPRGFPECGTDALRFTLAAYTGQDQNIRFSISRVEGYRKFCNKIWQAALGFALPHVKGMEVQAGVPTPATLADRWILDRLAGVAEDVNLGLEEFRVGAVTDSLYHFLWDELCSWYIEFLKPIFSGKDEAKRRAGSQVLRHVLDVSLRLLHPLMPFLTETLWQELPKSQGALSSIMIAPYPTAADGRPDSAAKLDAERLMDVITALRTIRADFEVKSSHGIHVNVHTDDAELAALLSENQPLIGPMARVETLTILPRSAPRSKGAATAVAAGAELLVPLRGLIDFAVERVRLEKERQKTVKLIKGAETRIASESFTGRAPVDVVTRERERLKEARSELAKLCEALDRLAEIERD